MISVLMPTRNREKEFDRAVNSIRCTSYSDVEIVSYIDDDSTQMIGPVRVKYIVGPRIVLSDCWNKCAEKASGDILMMGGDDMVFKTSGWDVLVERAYADCPDKILMVHGSDGMVRNDGRFGVFPTIHTKWVDATGYFVPPVFGGDYADTWLNDVANSLGRRTYLPYLTEHLHPAWGKAAMDSTYEEKFTRDKKDDATAKYAAMAERRLEDVKKLRAVMHGD